MYLFAVYHNYKDGYSLLHDILLIQSDFPPDLKLALVHKYVYLYIFAKKHSLEVFLNNFHQFADFLYLHH